VGLNVGLAGLGVAKRCGIIGSYALKTGIESSILKLLRCGAALRHWRPEQTDRGRQIGRWSRLWRAGG